MLVRIEPLLDAHAPSFRDPKHATTRLTQGETGTGRGQRYAVKTQGTFATGLLHQTSPKSEFPQPASTAVSDFRKGPPDQHVSAHTPDGNRGKFPGTQAQHFTS